MSKTNNFKDDFELIYLRGDYITKISNYDTGSLVHYKSTISTTAHMMFNKFRFAFEKVGFDINDILSVTNIYALAYMSIYSLKNNPQAMDKFIARYRSTRTSTSTPSVLELDRIERNMIINFLRQKLHHCSIVCERKARNITVGKETTVAFANTQKSIDADLETIVRDYKKLGYRKIKKKELKEIKENSKRKLEQEMKDENGFNVVEIQSYNRGLTYIDYRLIVDNIHSNIYNYDPEEAVLMMEESKNIESLKLKFGKLSPKERRTVLYKFINDNVGKSSYKQELKLARKLVEQLKQTPEMTTV